MIKNKKVLFIGAGEMAEAMISGMLKCDTIAAESITVVNRSNRERLLYFKARYKVCTEHLQNIAINHFDIIILAVKPKDSQEVISFIYKELKSHQLILSVMAGISLAYFEKHLPEQQIIRVMPNTSISIGESAIGISYGSYVSEENINLTKEWLTSIGSVFVIAEEQMDFFTAAVGSGPAYMYFFMQHMEQVGLDYGFDECMIREMIVQMMIGAAKMVQQTKEKPLSLQKKVTSPNGTTEAGINALEAYGGGLSIRKALESACLRSADIRFEFEKQGEKIIQ